MTQLRLAEIATRRGMNISAVSRQADVGLTTVRRMWHGTALGTRTGEPLRNVDLDVLERIAKALDVQPGDLFAPHSA